MRRALLLALVGCVGAAAGASATAPTAVRTELTVEVQPQRQDCFYLDAVLGEAVNVSVLVFRGGKLDVRLRIEGPESRIVFDALLFSNVDERTGRLLAAITRKGTAFEAPVPGVYSICLDNRQAKFTAKAVTLDVTVAPPRAAAAGDSGDPAAAAAAAAAVDGSITDTTAGIGRSARRLHLKLEQVFTAQHYAARREVRHRNTVESTNARVAWWSAGETSAIALSTLLLQVVVRAWFRRGGGSLPTTSSKAP